MPNLYLTASTDEPMERPLYCDQFEAQANVWFADQDVDAPPSTAVDIKKLCEPILETFAFQRLRAVSFLGILSPRYSYLDNHPDHLNGHGGDDGSRAEHSVGVARIFLDMVRKLHLSEEAQRYAVAWALLHDVATWPLSHTAEAPFESLFDTNSNLLRQSVLLGSKKLPGEMSVLKALRAVGVDPELLVLLLQHKKNELEGELSLLWDITHSPLTPDTLEGMARSGTAWSMDIPDPADIISSLYLDMFDGVCINRRKSSNILKFWRAKSRLYRRHINTRKAIDFESRWAAGIYNSFGSVNFVRSLYLSESALIRNVLEDELPRTSSMLRYKQPLMYFICSSYCDKKNLDQDVRVSDLRAVLMKAEDKSFGELARHGH
jgi:hypothetical protein